MTRGGAAVTSDEYGHPPEDDVSASTRAVVEDFLSILPVDLLVAVERYGAEDLTWAFPQSLTGGKVWAGKETVLRRLGRVLVNFESGSMAVRRRATAVSGTTAAAEFDLTARSARGAPYANTYVFFFTCVDGRIVSVREYMDTQVVLALFD